MDYQLHKTPWITSLSFFEWIDGLISRLSLFHDKFRRVWTRWFLLDLEGNSVVGFGKKFCYRIWKKILFLWQEKDDEKFVMAKLLTELLYNFDFYFHSSETRHLSLTKSEKKRRHISNKHNLKTNVPKSRITELNCSCKIDNQVTEDVANKVAIISYRRIAKTSQFYLQDHSVSRS